MGATTTTRTRTRTRARTRTRTCTRTRTSSSTSTSIGTSTNGCLVEAEEQEPAAGPAGQSSDGDTMLTVADLQAFFKGRDASDMFEKSEPTEVEKESISMKARGLPVDSRTEPT